MNLAGLDELVSFRRIHIEIIAFGHSKPSRFQQYFPSHENTQYPRRLSFHQFAKQSGLQIIIVVGFIIERLRATTIDHPNTETRLS